jgi:hypothetical protein
MRGTKVEGLLVYFAYMKEVDEYQLQLELDKAKDGLDVIRVLVPCREWLAGIPLVKFPGIEEKIVVP